MEPLGLDVEFWHERFTAQAFEDQDPVFRDCWGLNHEGKLWSCF